MNKQVWPAPAKLNLMLHITGQREDGYHELQTVFQFINFSDELEFTVRNDDEINRHCVDFLVSEDEDIIIRAAKLLRETYRKTLNNSAVQNDVLKKAFGVDIHLKKNIPMGAGLGGGSSDAATTLVALNHLWEMKFSVNEMAEMGLSLGADVPVFVHGFAAFAEGIGEKLSPINLDENWYLVLIPAVHVSTKEIFLHPELTRDCSAIKLCDLSRREWRNVCTSVVVDSYPEVGQAIDIISKYSKACMSGTGASVFTIFDTQTEAEAVLQKVKENMLSASWFSFVAKGLNQSPLYAELESQK